MHLDGLGLVSGHSIIEEDVMAIKRRCSSFLLNLVPEKERNACKIGLLDDDLADGMEIVSTISAFGNQPFVISTGPQHIPSRLNFDLTDISELGVIDASYCLKFQRIDTSLLNCPISPIIHQVFSALEMSFCLNGKLKQVSF